MKNHLVTGIVSSAAAVASLAIMSSFSSAEAASFSFNTSNFTGSDIKVNITLDDKAAGDGKIQFTVKMAADSPSIGDLRGIFFNISDNSLLSGLQYSAASGAKLDVKQSAYSTTGSLSSVGNANLNGDGGNHSFEFALEIGENGLKGGKDDIQSTTFVLSHATRKLDLSMFSQQDFGVRVTSVGTGNNREGSSKLVGTSPLPPLSVTPTPVPPAPAPAPSPVVTTPTPAPAPAPAPAPSPTPVLPPVNIEPIQNPTVITPPPNADPVPTPPSHPNQPTEIPEPGTIAALVLTGAGATRWLKRRNQAHQTI
jgi:hypothetical protein